MMALPKRIIVGCDGSWMNAFGEGGYVTFYLYPQDDRLQLRGNSGKPPSNVTRMLRCIRNSGADGKPQILMYHEGVGSSGRFLDSSIGGTFGLGLDQDIRDLYSFICYNYVDGDDIILVGFSRGAFTARSVADLLCSLGILTIDGFEHFNDIFDDYENMGSSKRENSEFLYQGLKPYGGQKGKARIEWEAERMDQYRQFLKEVRLQRQTHYSFSR